MEWAFSKQMNKSYVEQELFFHVKKYK